MMDISKIGIVGKQLPSGHKNRAVIKRLCKKIAAFGEIKLDQYTAEILSSKKFHDRKKLFDECDLIITMGGDGTILKAARSIHDTSPKVLGINLGNVGFLTEIRANEIESALKQIKKNTFRIDERFLLETKIFRDGREMAHDFTLNDAVINQGPFARLITMSLKINRQKAFTIRADGLIVATPTGSTGHSLSAGGPVIHPNVDCIIINPLCPVLLSIRPMIVEGSSQIVIKIAEKEGEKTALQLTLDGQLSRELEHGDEIHIAKAPHQMQFIRLPGRSHYQMVEEKLRWDERTR